MEYKCTDVLITIILNRKFDEDNGNVIINDGVLTSKFEQHKTSL
jgi:hypothetical protein